MSEFSRLFVKLCNQVDIWQSNTEEHNRYLGPPKGIDVTSWALGLMKNKYGDFMSSERLKVRRNDDNS